MRNLRATEEFESMGGSEFAPMSTTSDPRVAVAYGASRNSEAGCSLLFKVATSSFMERGADLSWCSAFPGESEFLYPPLTYLQPTSRREVVRLGSNDFTVIELTPHFAS